MPLRGVRTLVLAVLVAVPTTATAQVASDPGVAEAVAAVRAWLDAEQAYDRIPSVSAAIVHDQELVWSGAFGMAHPDRNVPTTTSTLYSICSISKLFTSVALMQLRDQGLVDLRDPVAKHLDWFTLHQQFAGSAPITVEGILTHSAGLPRESDQPYWSAPDFPFPTRDEIIAGLKNEETLYPAWEHFQYSNLGLTLAGEIVRARSGMPYDRYLREHVLQPLGLTNTYPEIPEQHRDGQLAQGYSSLTRDGTREPTPFFQAKRIAPAARYPSTAEDLAKFLSWQLRLREGGGEEVLKATTLEEMQRTYSEQPWGGEASAIRWKGGLALMSLPSDDPVHAIMRLKHVKGDVFRHVFDGRAADDLGEEIVFERDASGRVTGYRQFGNLSPRVR